MKNTLTVTIGIPAFNEEKNISRLLIQLIEQERSNFRLDKILVVSDGSTDKTVKEAAKIMNLKIEIINNDQRLGKSARINYIFKHSNSDVVIILDADTLLKSKNFIAEMVDAYINDSTTSLVAVKVLPINTNQGLIGKILAHSQIIKVYMGRHISAANPIYLCVGRAMGYSRKLYKQITFPPGLLAEDAYACLFCLSRNLPIKYQKKAEVFYTPPMTIEDHKKQSDRFYVSKIQLVKYFNKKFVQDSYSIPTKILFKSAFYGFIKSPYLTILYFLILVKMKLQTALNSPEVNHLWAISASSKGFKK